MENNFKLDRSSTIPFHQQLYRYIKKCIIDGTYKEKEVIPSEMEMQIKFDVSRITVRRAISDLEHDGYLRKRRGQGTIVEPIKKDKPLSTFDSFSGDAKVKGDKPGAIILTCKKLPASIKVAERLGIDPGENITFLKWKNYCFT
ncbi:MAG: GntR family transcriptional regulator [Bacilli bacterium]